MLKQLTPDSDPEDYLQFLDDCFVRQTSMERPDRAEKVAIVGAGMAGLTVAWVLRLYGYETKIFEASNRVGGRVRTLRDEFTPGNYVEAGAMRIPDTHELTKRLIKEFELDSYTFADDQSHPWVYVNGEWATMEEYLNADDSLRFAGGRVGSKLFEICMEPLRPYKEKKLKDNILTKMSLGDYLRGYMQGKNRVTEEIVDPPLSAMDVELILLEESRANMEASVMEVLRDHDAHVVEKKIQIKGGMDLLPKEFCERKFVPLDSILFNARVRKVDRDGPLLSVTYENTTTHEEHAEYNFDKVVLAAPFSSLCHVDLPLFENPHGFKKLRAIRSLHYENSTKIALEVDKQFWKFDQIEGGRSITDLPIRWVHYPSDEQCQGPHGVLLASYTWGEDSLRWSALPHETRVRYAFEHVKRLHKSAFKSPKYKDTQLIAGMSYSWADDSYSLGAFAIFPPHQEEFFEDMWEPYSDVHFAGEHTSLQHAWIEGAVASGLRAAQEVHAAL